MCDTMTFYTFANSDHISNTSNRYNDIAVHIDWLEILSIRYRVERNFLDDMCSYG